jgi:adenosylcobyric acid synthase
MSARCIMVLGTSSGAGKSWIATALCRYYVNRGYKVAPFKAQNMSNNARVVATPEGDHPAAGPFPRRAAAPSGDSAPCQAGERGGQFGEIGAAQYFQALAARTIPDVRMNPLLLKPETDTHSQAVLLGQVRRELSDTPWHQRSERVWPHIAAALDALRADNDIVVIEGAGSPAEINLMHSDIVNLRVARHAGAACLLVTDIDRGGAFAHLYGTWALLPEADRARLKGFVLNNFRGDAALLAPAPEQLQQLTGVPTVAVVPMLFGHGLPEEDGVFSSSFPRRRESISATSARCLQQTPLDSRLHGNDEKKAFLSGAVIAVIAYPRISNLDEFQPLHNLPGVHLIWARSPAELTDADCIVLPGSKATAADLAWLRAQRLDAAIARHAARGGRVLGICGGLQMLGEALIDLHGMENQGNAPGLGLLPLVTSIEPRKTVRHTRTRFGALHGPWSPLSGVAASGYEIHHGQTAQHPAMAAKGDVAHEVIAGLAWQNTAGNVLGVYLHGLFEDAAVVHTLFGARAPTLDEVFERLAGTLQAAAVPGFLDRLAAPLQP